MKIKYLTLVCVALGLTSCKKENNADNSPASQADFTLETNNPASPLSVATYDTHYLSNKSTNAKSYKWDFGNGKTSTDSDAYVSYERSGNYKISLTVINSAGKSTVVSKQVTVLDRVLKQVIIKKFNWGISYGNWPSITKAKVWIEILRGDNNATYTYDPQTSYNAPMVYKSPVIDNVTPTSSPVVFTVPNKIIIDMPAFHTDPGYYKGIGYIFNVYAQEGGKTFLLSSGNFSGVSTLGNGTPATNSYVITSGLLELDCDFEQ